MVNVSESAGASSPGWSWEFWCQLAWVVLGVLSPGWSWEFCHLDGPGSSGASSPGWSWEFWYQLAWVVLGVLVPARLGGPGSSVAWVVLGVLVPAGLAGPGNSGASSPGWSWEFWCQLARVVPDKGPMNSCDCCRCEF